MNLRSFKRFFGGGSRQVRRPERTGRKRSKTSVPLQIETLEDRSMMSTLPAAIVTDKAQLDFFDNNANPVFGSQIVMDPVNPNTLVEVHSWNGNNNVGQIWGNFSFDGGKTWASTAGVFLNSALTDPSTNLAYPQISNTSVTFDRANRNTVYVVSTQHNPATNSGALVFNKFTLSSSGFTQDTSLGNIPGNPGEYLLYRWFHGNPALSNPAFNPYIAIDNNEPTYTDPVTGLVQTDTLATLVDDPFDPDPTRLIPKGIYVAFNTVNAHRLDTAIQQVSDVYVMASADGGHNWSTQQYVLDNFPNTPQHFIYANDPRISFAQGTPVDPNDPGAVPRVQGGTMNVLMNDSFNGSNAQLFLDQSLPDGGVAAEYPVAAQRFVDNSNQTIRDPLSDNIPVTTNFTINVNINAPAFAPFDITTLADLDVELHLATPNTRHLAVSLIDPNGNTYVLLFNGVDSANNATGRGVADSDLGLGVITGPGNSKNRGGLFFDLDAPMGITDSLLVAPWVGHFRPEGFGWDNLYNNPVNTLNGPWTLRVTDFRDSGDAPPQFLLGWGLHFTSKIDTNGFGFESGVATAGVRPAVNNMYLSSNLAAPATSNGIPVGAVFAYDNTLGSFSPFQGRLYVAYTSGSAANPNIAIRYSDDNGASWSQVFTVNDDSAADNFSEGNRSQFMPALAVDPVTGAVVVTYYDGRMDAAGARVANSVSVSIDGGRSWSPSVFLNELKTAGDFLTGETHVLEPIPGNMSLNGSQGFGDHQGLIAYNGRAIPTFGSNLDARTSQIRSAVVSYAAGPRVVSGDMGPVVGDFNNPDNPNVFTYNNTFAADGTRRLDAFVINFDRPVDPSSFTSDDVTVQYRNPDGTISTVPIGVQSVTPLNVDQPHGAVDNGTQPTVSIGDALVIEGDSGVAQAVFEIMLSRPQLNNVVVGFATRDGSAVAGLDYVARTGQATIPVGQVRATFTVDVNGDLRNEGAETFFVEITSLTSPGVKRDRDVGVGRIIDDDGVPTISVGDAFIQEGNSGTKIMSFPVVLSIADPTGAVTVNFATAAITGGATANVDYNTTFGTLVFNAGQTTAVINVVIRGDTDLEDVEAFELVLANPTPDGIVLGRSVALGRIVDDDTVGAMPSVLIGDAIVKEGDSGVAQATFTATLSAVQAGNVVIDYQTQNGTATAPQDYAAKTGQLVILAGQTTGSFTVDVNGDVRSEGILETFSVLFTMVTPGITLPRTTAVGSIVDDDAAPTITLGDAILREGDGGSQLMSFPAALSVPDFDNPVTFNYDTFDASAAASTATLRGDYGAVAGGLFTFAPGQTTGTIEIEIFGDIRVEPGTEIFGLQGANAAGASFARDTAFGHILEDDNIGTPPTVSIGDAIVTEGDAGTAQATFKVVLSQQQPRDVVIGYATRDGSAAAGQDYDAKTGVVVIPQGRTEATFTIDVRGDTVAEGNQTFFVDLTSATSGIVGMRTTGIGAIVDDDGALTVNIGDLIVKENDGGTLTYQIPVILSEAAAADVTVFYRTIDDTATAPRDYVAIPVTALVISAGATSAFIQVQVHGDAIKEGDEQFFVELSSAAGAAIAKPLATVIIVDDDSALGATQFLVRITPQDRVGTYSYAIGPDVRSRIHWFDHVNRPIGGAAPLVVSNVMDQNNNSIRGENDTVNAFANDRFAMPTPNLQVPFQGPYDPDTLPLIIPGPHVVSNGFNASFNDNVFSKQANESVPDLGNPVGNPAGTLFSTLAVSGLTGWITDVNVRVNLDYPDSGDLRLLLRAANGRTISLASFHGDGNFYLASIFDDQAPTSINVQDPHGPFYRVQPNGNLSLLNGIKSELLNGNWQLEVRGGNSSGSNSSGVLKGWALDIQTSQFTDNLILNGGADHVDVIFDRDMDPATFTAADVVRIVGPAGVITGAVSVAPMPGAPASIANRAFRVSFPNQTLSGTYQLTLGSNIASSAGHRIDANLNVGVDILRGGDPSSGPLTAKTYKDPFSTTPASSPANPGLNKPIPANSTITTTIQIADQFKITQGPPADFNRHIQVFVDIAHSQDPDLAAVLIAPDGTEIRLFSNVGVNARLTFDDFVSSPPPSTGGVFQVGTNNPQIPLSRLQGKFTSGLWTLRVTNNGITAGTLKGFNLHFPYFASGSGLGEPIADQFTTDFRIFTMDATNPVSDSVWTAVGPAASNQHGSAGRVNAIAVDPSDPSGNTVYIGAANGGVWKTTNFLTTNPQGPTYVPLTDLGPSNSLNVNHIAILPRNNDPHQSIIFVGTGDTDANAPGIGLLRSLDGGASWQVIDSTNQNFGSDGNPLPLSSSQRDHLFVGTRVNKVVIDPTVLPEADPLNPKNEYAVYIAVGGGGIQGVYRSLDTGKSWTLIRAGNATDVALAAASGADNGVLQRLVAAFEDDGTYYTTSAPSASSLVPMLGGVGKPNHIDGFYGTAIPVAAPASTPNGANRGRILIATPPKTGDRLADTFLQNWVYALVIDNTGLLFDLYVTKDLGDNWTRVVIPVSGNAGTPAEGFGVPTNDENITVSSSIRNLYPSFPSLGGDYSVALTIDPNNPNIVYLAGDLIIKVDITTIADPWAVINGDHSDNVAGAVNGSTDGPIAPFGFMLDGGVPQTPGGLSDPNSQTDFLNMYRDPFNPFGTPATFTYATALPPLPRTTWTNTGADIRWAYFSQIHDTFDQSNSPPFRAHELLAVRDPLTGKTRILLGNDQGVFTAVDRGDGTLHTGIGAADSVRGSRNGNLQIAQFVAGAVQPSTLAADVAGSLFYGLALNNGTPASSAAIIGTGNLNWQTYDETGVNDLIATAVDGNGSWIVTDATGGFDRIADDGSVIFDPNRMGTTYQYRWPCCINQVNLGTNDFFIIDFPNQTPISRTTGLLGQSWPPGSFNLFRGGTPRPFGRFAVNPLDPGALVISSQTGRVFRSAGPLDGFGIQWRPIAEPAVLDGTPAQALAFGSPAGTALNLNDFIYAGTNGGDIYVTRNGGGSWRDISAGLDGGTVLAVVPNPRRGSNEAYAITGLGVYWMQDSSVAAPAWVKINDAPGRGSLFNFMRPVFNNPNDKQPIMLPGQITSLAIDWRYAIPDNLNNPNGPKHPVIYVAGNAGVFRSTTKGAPVVGDGATPGWDLYPDALHNQAPQEGGFLPNVYVADLDLMLGYLNPRTGTTNHAASHNLLMATTYGRGAFAIRLDDAGFSQFLVDFTSGPRIIDVDQVSPNPGFVLTGFDVTFDSLVDKTSFTPADVQLFAPNGQRITVQDVVEISTAPPGGLNPHNRFRITFAQQTASGNYRLVIGPNLSDFGGNRMNQDNDSTNGEDPADRYDNLHFFEPNTPPTISDIQNVSVVPNSSIDIGFRIGDGQTPNQLTLSATISDPSLIVSLTFNGNPNPSLAVSTTPTINITVGGQIGTATITVTVTDPLGLTSSDSFNVFINNPPTLLPASIPNFSGGHGLFPVSNHVTLSGTDPDGDTVSFGGNAFANANFTDALGGYVQVNATTGQVDLTPARSFVGTYYVRVFSTDGKAQTFGSFTVTVTNNAPSLAPISDITAHHREFPMVVTLNGSDPDPGENLTYSAKAFDATTHKAFQLDQSLGLFPAGAKLNFNRFNRKEKHFVSLVNGRRYFILPTGHFFLFTGRWAGPRKKLRGVFVDQLPPQYWAVPSLLFNAPPPTELHGLLSVNGNELTLSPGSFIGTFIVEATVTDGAASASRTYRVTTLNSTPVFNSIIGSVTAERSQFPQSRTLDGGDADGADVPFLTYSAQAFEAESYRLRQLDTQFGLFSNGNYSFNKYKKREKHIKGAGNKNFFILPSGFLFQRIGPPTSTRLRGRFIAALPRSVWVNPALLWNSQDPTVLNGFVSVNGNQIDFTPDNDFTGVFFVDAKVSDGVSSATQSIQVNVQ